MFQYVYCAVQEDLEEWRICGKLKQKNEDEFLYE
jgi:hypothetical protein